MEVHSLKNNQTMMQFGLVNERLKATDNILHDKCL